MRRNSRSFFAPADKPSTHNKRHVWRIVLLALLLPSTGIAQQPTTVFRERVSIDVQPQTIRTLETAREHAAQRQWDEAIPMLQQLIEDNGQSVVPVEPGRYWNTADFCHLLISRFPADGLKAYRDRFDSQSAEWFEEGKASLNESSLRLITQTMFNSSVGDDALWLLGELAFEQGRFAQARGNWQLLIPPTPETEEPEIESSHLTYPDSDYSSAKVHARLILCSILEGDASRAEAELSVFKSLHPDAEGRIAGQVGRLSLLLDQTLAESRDWTGTTPATRNSVTFASNPSRNAINADTPRPTRILWTRPLPDNHFIGPTSRPALGDSRPLAFYPLVWNGIVFIRNSDSIYAFDLATGAPKWPVEGDDSGEIFTNLVGGRSEPDLRDAGVARYTMSAAGGRLFARMGAPLVRRSPHEGNVRSEIEVLDIATKQGFGELTVSSAVFDPEASSPEATGWSFEGTPLVIENRMYGSLRRGSPEEETIVVCLDADSGRLIWRRLVCASLQNSADQYNLIGTNLLTYGDGILFLATGTGAIAALSAESGRLLWVFTYETNDSLSPEELSDPARQGLVPCVYAQGIVYAAPSDTHLLYALDASTGHLVWKERLPERVLNILGVNDGRLFTSGKSLWAFEAGTGRIAWDRGPRIGFDDPAGYGTGRPVLTTTRIFWPIRDEILILDQQTGRPVDRIPLRESFGIHAGNLLLAEGRLIITQDDQIIVMGTAEHFVSPPPVTPRKTQNDDKNKSDPARKKPKASLPPITQTDKPPQARRLWPARRAWARPLPAAADIRIAESINGNSPSLILLSHAGRLEQLSSETGAVAWSIPEPTPAIWSARLDQTLIHAGESGVESRNVENGTVQWRRHFAADSWSRSESETPLLLAIGQERVTAIDMATGQDRWTVSRRDGGYTVSNSARLFRQSLWTSNGTFGLFGSSGTAARLLIDLKTGHSNQVPSLSDFSRGVPELIHSGQQDSHSIVGVTPDHSVFRRLLKQPQQNMNSSETGWKHKVKSLTHGSPELFRNGEALIVIEDAQFGVRLDPQTGEVMWKVSLGPLPLADVIDAAVLTDTHLVAVSDGILRAISVDSGKLVWRCHLGPGEWNLRTHGNTIVGFPVTETNESHENTESLFLVVCAADSGRLIQRLRLSGNSSRRSFLAGSDTGCLIDGDRLIGLRPYASTDQKAAVGTSLR